MSLLEIAQKIRAAWDALFRPAIIVHLEGEVLYLRNEVAALRLDKNLLQVMLNDVSVAGQILYRRDHPPKKPEQVTSPGPKRWAEVLAEREQEIADSRRQAVADKVAEVKERQGVAS